MGGPAPGLPAPRPQPEPRGQGLAREPDAEPRAGRTVGPRAEGADLGRPPGPRPPARPGRRCRRSLTLASTSSAAILATSVPRAGSPQPSRHVITLHSRAGQPPRPISTRAPSSSGRARLRTAQARAATARASGQSGRPDTAPPSLAATTPTPGRVWLLKVARARHKWGWVLSPVWGGSRHQRRQQCSQVPRPPARGGLQVRDWAPGGVGGGDGWPAQRPPVRAVRRVGAQRGTTSAGRATRALYIRVPARPKERGRYTSLLGPRRRNAGPPAQFPGCRRTAPPHPAPLVPPPHPRGKPSESALTGNSPAQELSVAPQCPRAAVLKLSCAKTWKQEDKNIFQGPSLEMINLRARIRRNLKQRPK